MNGYVFKEGDKLYMIRCPYCGKENYALCVSSGQCAWCGKFAKEHVIMKKMKNAVLTQENLDIDIAKCLNDFKVTQGE